jgi:hypothetical protein
MRGDAYVRFGEAGRGDESIERSAPRLGPTPTGGTSVMPRDIVHTCLGRQRRRRPELGVTDPRNPFESFKPKTNR